MRETLKLLLAFLIVGLVSRPGVSQQVVPGAIQGTILRLGTEEPVSKVTVELTGGAQRWITTTEGDGRFYFPNLRPGEYRVTAKRDGYVPAEFAQRWLNGPGQPIPISPARSVSIQLWMFPTASISGRVTSADGQPVANAQVSALRASYDSLQRVLKTVQETRTNELGEYRLFWLTPGRYYLAAVVPPISANGPAVVNGVGTSSPGMDSWASPSRPVLGLANGMTNLSPVAEAALPPPLFFESTPESDLALPIDLAPGDQYRGADIRMTSTPTYHVCGTIGIQGPLPQALARAAIASATSPAPALSPPRGAATPVLINPLPDEPDAVCPDLTGGSALPSQLGGAIRLSAMDTRVEVNNASGRAYTTYVDTRTGKFAFRNVRAGVYELSANLAGMNGHIPLEVRADVESVALTVSAGVALQVHTVVEAARNAKPPQLAMLRPYLGDDPTSRRDPYLGTATSTGLTVIPNVIAGAYRVYVEPILNSVAPAATIPESLQNAYVKSITFAGADALNGPLEFQGRPGGVIEIVIGTHPGTLEGRVVNENQEVVPGALVMILPALQELRIFRSDMYKLSATDSAGGFRIRSIPPGEYKVFAWAGVEKDAWMDPNFLRAYEDRGTTIHVNEGQTHKTDLQLISPQF